jgi:transcriptional regulator with XRE-family HTH domain
LEDYILAGGESLRQIRERLGLTLRDVEGASSRLAEKYGNPDYLISLSRLSDIETKGVTPSLYKLYSFSAIYRRDFRELLGLYGIDLQKSAGDSDVVSIPKTHAFTDQGSNELVEVPIRLDPGFDARTTSAVGRMIVKWGTVPLTALWQFRQREYTYGYIGTEDLTMYPLLLPGSFVQIDESLRKIAEGPWRSEYERPIYFLETRDGFVCSWCELNGQMLAVRPHPMSPARTQMFRHGSEVEVLGQVVGIAMRLGGWESNGNGLHGKG